MMAKSLCGPEEHMELHNVHVEKATYVMFDVYIVIDQVVNLESQKEHAGYQG